MHFVNFLQCVVLVGCIAALADLSGNHDRQAVVLRQLAAQPQLPDAPKAKEAPKDAPEGKVAPVKFLRGLKKPADIEERHARSWAKHKHNLKALPQVTATSFDCRTAGWVPDFDDQGRCGSCWVFSGGDCCASAFLKAGYGKLTISKQQLLDCHFRDACGGGWPEDVAKVAKEQGLVTDADYGVPYKAFPGSCKSVDASKIKKIADYGFVSQGSGVANYQDFKNAMMKFGVISICYDAEGTPSGGPNGPVWKGTGGRNVDHAIKAIAFDDSKSPKGAVLCWNQWYNDERDYFWAEWGANQLGDSAMWTTATALPPVPPTPPNPGTFTPPFFDYVGATKIGHIAGYADLPAATSAGQQYANAENVTVTVKDSKGALAATLTPNAPPVPVGTSIVIDPVNKVVTVPSDWRVVGGNGSNLQADLTAAGWSPALIADILKLLGDLKAKAGFLVIFGDLAAIMKDLTTAQEAEKPKAIMPINRPEDGLPCCGRPVASRY